MVVPSISGGTHTFKAQDASGNNLTASFSITATLSTSPSSGPVDTTEAIIGKGFRTNSPIYFTFDGAP